VSQYTSFQPLPPLKRVLQRMHVTLPMLVRSPPSHPISIPLTGRSSEFSFPHHNRPGTTCVVGDPALISIHFTAIQGGSRRFAGTFLFTPVVFKLSCKSWDSSRLWTNMGLYLRYDTADDFYYSDSFYRSLFYSVLVIRELGRLILVSCLMVGLHRIFMMPRNARQRLKFKQVVSQGL
jgi:hypothetical protein